MIDYLTELIPKHKSLNNNELLRNPNTKGEGEVGRANTSDYIRSNKKIHYIDD
ncbi:MAG TPA: hypothetical protein VHG34_05200 [Nitrososphaeraceae archaeon]|nr:hypothetical protein [Nitrososphaeraceae archaeon]